MMHDPIHLNEKGNGALAQEIFMRLAYSAPLKERVQTNTNSAMSLKQIQNFLETQLKESQKTKTTGPSPAIFWKLPSEEET